MEALHILPMFLPLSIALSRPLQLLTSALVITHVPDIGLEPITSSMRPIHPWSAHESPF